MPSVARMAVPDFPPLRRMFVGSTPSSCSSAGNTSEWPLRMPSVARRAVPDFPPVRRMFVGSTPSSCSSAGNTSELMTALRFTPSAPMAAPSSLILLAAAE
ncbi:hypothetical protein BGV60_05825 [Burkholderia ubonensis]|nr:hypothetical protein BGV60_05825 [Burkholderia ubonensis]